MLTMSQIKAEADARGISERALIADLLRDLRAGRSV